jgi:endonuclease I
MGFSVDNYRPFQATDARLPLSLQQYFIFMSMRPKNILVLLALLAGMAAQAQVNIATVGTPYTQDFNTLANTGTANTALPTGWLLAESGTGANTSYAADNGGMATGNTYSYGASGNTERAFGGLQSGAVVPTLGVGFVNNSGSTITTLTIAYTGEQWRAGLANRTVADTLNFQYSLDATGLTSGTWTDENNLDFFSPTLNVAAGALDGNAAANRTAKNFTITGLNIPNGASFYLRWTDFNIASSDDGLGIDDLTVTFNGAVTPPCTEPTAQPASFGVTSPTQTSLTVSFSPTVPPADEYLVVRSTSPTLSANPADGVTYSVGQALGGGTVISYGTNTVIVDAGLTPNTTYYYFAFAYNSENCTGGPNYLVTAPATGNNTTLPLQPCLPPLLAPFNLSLTPGSISVSGFFNPSPSNRHLVVMSTSPTLSANPVDGVIYSVGQSLGGATVVAWNSNLNGNFFVSGLNPSTTYYFFVFAASGDCGGEPVYLTTSFATASTTTTNGSGGIPPNYYASAAGLTCQPLKTALKNIISSGTQVLSYTPGLWNLYYYSDVRRNDANTANIVWDMYSDLPTGSIYYNGTPEIQYTLGTDQCGSYSNEGDCYNREHSFPQGWFNSTSPMVSDAHHVFATDGKVNGIRGNFPYGEVNKANTGSSQYYKSKNESYRGTPAATMGYGGLAVFEPRDEYKGDFARAQLYMAVRYEDQINGWYSNADANEVLLSPTDEPDAAKRKLQVYDDWHIRLLYKWHLQDPVSQKEIDRNNVIYYQDVTDGGGTRRQGNRNPFVDHPEYVALIWQCTNAVPVTLIDFTAAKYGNGVVLQWQATRESNFKQYEIERSADGVNFAKIGTVGGQNLFNYQFTDAQLPAVKAVYYRLKLVDTDGKFVYSKTLAIRLNGLGGAFVYPNPTSGQFTLQLQNPLAEAAMLTISDMAGRVVRQVNVAARQATIQLDASALPTGRYFIKILGQETVVNQSFNVVR